jgi:hypothetical protein
MVTSLCQEQQLGMYDMTMHSSKSLMTFILQTFWNTTANKCTSLQLRKRTRINYMKSKAKQKQRMAETIGAALMICHDVDENLSNHSP